MKRSILILITTILTLTACLQEGIEGCPDYIRLTFVYEKAGKGYDEVIGNDVHLRLYKDGIIFLDRIIPYQQIAGEKEYIIKKQVTGEIDIVAWAVPAKEDFVASIPQVPQSGSKFQEKVTIQPRTRTSMYQSIGHIYLGTLNYYDPDISNQVRAKVPMNECIAQFTATLHTLPDSDVQQIQPQDLWFDLYGTKAEMDINFTPTGEDAIIHIPFVGRDEKGALQTAMHGLLPSEQEEFLTVKAYKKGVHLFTLTTQHQSSPGDIIHMDVYGKHVTLQINDWRVMDASVEWI